MSIADKLITVAENVSKVYETARQREYEQYSPTFIPNEKLIADVPELGDEKMQTIANNVEKVYEAGTKKGYDEFWDEFQENGNRTAYSWRFAGSSWTNSNFKPKYDIVPKGTVDSIFANSKITDLIGCLRKQGVVLDFSKAYRIHWICQMSEIQALGVVDATNCDLFTNTIFGENYRLKTVEKLIFRNDGSQSQGSKINLTWAVALQNITIEGVIGASIDIPQSSGLTIESLKSIINALKDYSGTTETRTLTLHANAKSRLTDADIATITQKGWTLA